MPEESSRYQVVEYNPQGIDINAPSVENSKAIAYVRPDDVITFHFDVNNIKVDVLNGDVHIVFGNGASVTLVSLAALGFSSMAPTLKDDGDNVYTLDQFLSKTEVLNFNEAVLILTNRDSIQLSINKPDVVKQSAEKDADDVESSPVSNDGVSNNLTRGVPAKAVNYQAHSDRNMSEQGRGQYVVSNLTTNRPFNQDQDKNKPGTSHITQDPSIKSSIWYGTTFVPGPQVTMNNIDYKTYQFRSGLGTFEEPESMLAQNVINDTSNQNVFINNHVDQISYVLKLDYKDGIQPNSISIVVPNSVASGIILSTFPGSAVTLGEGVAVSSGIRYNLSNIDPSGVISLLLSVATDIATSTFNMKYEMTFLDPATGLSKNVDITYSIAVASIRNQADLTALGSVPVVSSSAPPISVSTGTGDDIIVAGSGNNSITSAGGANKIFTGAGNDEVVFGSGGNNKIWGSLGTDIIRGTGDFGNNTVYYNDFHDNIDDQKINFKDDYFNTLLQKDIPFDTYLGYSKDSLDQLVKDLKLNDKEQEQKLINAIENGSIFVKKGATSGSSGVDVLTRVPNVYLSNGKNTLYVSDKYASQASGIVYNITGYSPDSDAYGASPYALYTLNLDGNNFAGDATVDIGKGVVMSSTSKNADGKLLNFINFNVFEGRANQSDTFIAGINKVYKNMTIDGKGGSDNIVDYSLLPDDITQGIVFQADGNRAVVYKDGIALGGYKDNLLHIQRIVGSKYDDVFYGDISSGYVFDAGQGRNKVDYSRVTTSGVRYDVGQNKVYKSTSADYLNSKVDVLNNIQDIVLTPSNDVISSDVVGSHDFNGGGGVDALTYDTIDGSIVYTIAPDSLANNYGKATIVKTGKNGETGEDTFSVSTSNIQYVQNISIVEGSKDGDDTFNLDVFDKNALPVSMVYDGKGGVNTLTYANSKIAKGQEGVRFAINGGVHDDEYSTVYRAGGTDRFKNFEHIVGSKGNDTVYFTNKVKLLSSMKSYNFDLNTDDSNNNTADFSGITWLQDIDASKASQSTGSKFSVLGDYQIRASFGVLEDPEKATFVGKDDEHIDFHGVNKVVGTNNNDLFVGTAQGNYIFDGNKGINTVDYTAVDEDLVFDLKNNAVQKGVVGKDDIYNASIFLGSNTHRNDFYISGQKTYQLVGNDQVVNNLYYNKLSTGITVDFENSRVYRGNILYDNIVADQQGPKVLVFDSYKNISNIYGSEFSDRYLAFKSDVAKVIELNAGVGTNTLDFSKIVDAADRNLVLNLDKKLSDIIVANVTWRIKDNNQTFPSINAFKGTKEGDNTYNISNYRSKLVIDAGAKGATEAGNNIVSYENDVNNGLLVGIYNNIINVDRVYSNSEMYKDSLENTNILRLSKNADEKVTIGANGLPASLKELDANGYKRQANGNDPVNKYANEIIFDEIGPNVDRSILINVEKGLLPSLSYVNSANVSTPVTTLIKNFHSYAFGVNRAVVAFSNDSFLDVDSTKFGLQFRGASVNSNLKLDFSAVKGGIELVLNPESDDLLKSKATNKSIITRFDNIAKMVLSSDSYISNGIYNSSIEFTGADSSTTGNTLDYSNITEEKNGIYIIFNEARVYKGNPSAGKVLYDTFDKSFTLIKGTRGKDTVIVTDLSNSSAGKLEINLGYKDKVNPSATGDNQDGSDNVLKIDISDSVYYNLTKGLLSTDPTAAVGLDISNIKGVSDLSLSNKAPNTLKITGIVDQSKIPYKSIDGGEYYLTKTNPANSDLNVIDVSESDKYLRVVIVLEGQRIAQKIDPNESGKFQEYGIYNFSYIKGSKAGSSFESLNTGSYIFEGYQNATKGNTLSYASSKTDYTIEFNGKQSGIVRKAGDSVDKFSNINNIIGGQAYNSYILNSSDFSVLDGMFIKGSSGNRGASIVIKAPIVTMFLKIDKGTTTGTNKAAYDLELSNGTPTGKSNFSVDKIDAYSFDDSVRDINLSINTDPKESLKFIRAASNYQFKATYNIDSNISFDAQSSILERVGGYRDVLQNLTHLNHAGKGTLDIVGAVTKNHKYEDSGTGDMNISYAEARGLVGGILVNFTLDADGFYQIKKGDTYVDKVKNATSITGVSKGDNVYAIVDNISKNTSWKVVTINGFLSDMVSFESFYGDLSSSTQEYNFSGQDLRDASKYGYKFNNISRYKLTGKGTFNFVAQDIEKNYFIDGGTRGKGATLKDKAFNYNVFDYSLLGQAVAKQVEVQYIYEDGKVLVSKNSINISNNQVQSSVDTLYHVNKIIGTKDGNDIFNINNDLRAATIETYDKASRDIYNEINFGKLSADYKLIFNYKNDGSLVVNQVLDNETIIQNYKYMSKIQVSSNSEVHVESLSESHPVVFSAPSKSSAIFYIGDTPNIKDVHVNYKRIGKTTVKLNDNDETRKIVASLTNFGGVKAEGSTTAIHIYKEMKDYGTFIGSASQHNTVNYSGVGKSNLVFSSHTVAKVTSSSMQGGYDTYENFYEFHLGNNADSKTVTLAKVTNPKRVVTIDGGSSDGSNNDNSVILGAGYDQVVIDFSAGNSLKGMLEGYNLKNFSSYQLTEKGNDKVIIGDDSINYKLDGGGATNTIDYSKVTTRGVSISLNRNPTSGLPDILTINKSGSTGSNTDVILRFQNIILNYAQNNSFSYIDFSKGDNYNIDFGNGAKNALVDFNNSITKDMKSTSFKFTDKGLAVNVTKNDKSQVNLLFKNLVTLTANQNFDDIFEFNSDYGYKDLKINGNTWQNANQIVMSGSKELHFLVAGDTKEIRDGIAPGSRNIVSYQNITSFVGTKNAVNTFYMSIPTDNNKYKINGGDSKFINIFDGTKLVPSTEYHLYTTRIESTETLLLSNISKIILSKGNVVYPRSPGYTYNNNVLTLVGNEEATLDVSQYNGYTKKTYVYHGKTIYMKHDGITYNLEGFNIIKMKSDFEYKKVTPSIDLIIYEAVIMPKQYYYNVPLNTAPTYTIMNIIGGEGNVFDNKPLVVNISDGIISYNSKEIMLSGYFSLAIRNIKDTTIKITDPSILNRNIRTSFAVQDNILAKLDLTEIPYVDLSLLYNENYLLTASFAEKGFNSVVNLNRIIFANNATGTVSFSRDAKATSSVDIAKLVNIVGGESGSNKINILGASLPINNNTGLITIKSKDVLLGSITDGNAASIKYYAKFTNFVSIITDETLSKENINIDLSTSFAGKLSSIKLAKPNAGIIHKLDTYSLLDPLTFVLDSTGSVKINLMSNYLDISGINYMQLRSGLAHRITIQDFSTPIVLFSETKNYNDISSYYTITPDVSNVYLVSKTINGLKSFGAWITNTGPAQNQKDLDDTSLGMFLPNVLSLTANSIDTLNIFLNYNPILQSNNNAVSMSDITSVDGSRGLDFGAVNSVNMFFHWKNVNAVIQPGSRSYYDILDASGNKIVISTVLSDYNASKIPFINLGAPMIVGDTTKMDNFAKLSASNFINVGQELNTSVTIGSTTRISGNQAVFLPYSANIFMPMVIPDGKDGVKGTSQLIVDYVRPVNIVSLIYTKDINMPKELGLKDMGAGFLGFKVASPDTSDTTNSVKVYNVNYMVYNKSGVLQVDSSIYDMLQNRSKVYAWDEKGNASLSKQELLFDKTVLDNQGMGVYLHNPYDMDQANYRVVAGGSHSQGGVGAMFYDKDTNDLIARINLKNFLYYANRAKPKSMSQAYYDEQLSSTSYSIGGEFLLSDDQKDPTAVYTRFIHSIKHLQIYDVRDNSLVNLLDGGVIAFLRNGEKVTWAVGNKDITMANAVPIDNGFLVSLNLEAGRYLIIQHEGRIMFVNNATADSISNPDFMDKCDNDLNNYVDINAQSHYDKSSDHSHVNNDNNKQEEDQPAVRSASNDDDSLLKDNDNVSNTNNKQEEDQPAVRSASNDDDSLLKDNDNVSNTNNKQEEDQPAFRSVFNDEDDLLDHYYELPNAFETTENDIISGVYDPNNDHKQHI